MKEEIERLLALLRNKDDDIHDLRQLTKQYEIQVKDSKRDDELWNEQQNEMNRLN